MSGLERVVAKIHGELVQYNTFVPFEKRAVNTITGSAFFVGPDEMLTCYHCVDECLSLTISMPIVDKTRHPVKVIAVIPELDLAVLRGTTKRADTWLPLSTRPVQHMETVSALGYPLDSDNLKYTKGIISGTDDEFIQVDAGINPGNSGGPVVRDGEVVGVISQKIEFAESTGFAVPVGAFLPWLDYIKQNYKGEPLVIRLFDPRIRIANLNEEVLQILQQREAFPKERVGVLVTRSWRPEVRPGDIILRVDGETIDNFGYTRHKLAADGSKMALEKAVKLIGPAPSVRCTIFRSQRVVDIQVAFHTAGDAAIREVYRPFESLPCAVIGGIVFMELRINHIDSMTAHSKIPGPYKVILLKHKIEDPYRSVVIISAILIGSPILGLEAVDAGDIVKRVNGKRVASLADLSGAIAQQDLVSFEMRSNHCLIYPLQKLRQIDDSLLNTYDYAKHRL